jgi:hypothetical protein
LIGCSPLGDTDRRVNLGLDFSLCRLHNSLHRLLVLALPRLELRFPQFLLLGLRLSTPPREIRQCSRHRL